MIRSLVLVLVLTAMASAGTPAPSAARPATGSVAKLDRRIAIVDGGAVWQSELDEAIVHTGVPAPTKDQLAQVLDALIDAVLVDQAADALHVEASDAELDAAIAEIIKQNGIDEAGLDKALAEQHFTRASYRVELARQLRAQKLFQLVLVPRVVVTEDDIAKAYAAKKAITPGIDALDKIHDTIKQMVWSEKLAAEQETWLESKRAVAHIERRL
jgi:tRNA(Phe) wybutosine-synthesizing methylase Tyw3